MTPLTMRVRIGRLVLDGRVAAGSRDAIGEALQTELASLLSDRGGPADRREQSTTSLSSSIAAGIAARLDTMSVRTHSSPSSPSVGTPHGVTHG